MVDRRWWAKAESDAEPATDTDRQRKPTYVEELEQRVADHAAHLQTVMAEHKKEGYVIGDDLLRPASVVVGQRAGA